MRFYSEFGQNSQRDDSSRASSSMILDFLLNQHVEAHVCSMCCLKLAVQVFHEQTTRTKIELGQGRILVA